MRHENGKICGVDDVQARQELTRGEHEFSCSICCSTSDDASKLCQPTEATNDLFCKGFSGN